jgi:hypothetical protein
MHSTVRPARKKHTTRAFCIHPLPRRTKPISTACNLANAAVELQHGLLFSRPPKPPASPPHQRRRQQELLVELQVIRSPAAAARAARHHLPPTARSRDA